jgi:hypothetical protein
MVSNFYRNFHLKKYFLGRWKRAHFLLKNLKIANLKFISKFIHKWKKAVMFSKNNKTYSIYLFDNLLTLWLQKSVKSLLNSGIY